MMENKENLISRSILFKGLPAPILRQLAGIAQERRFYRNEVIFFERDEAVGFYLVAQGQVKVFKMSLDGREQILHVFGPGEPFGEVAVFSGQPFPANAASMGPSATLFFPRHEFVSLLHASPDMALSMLAMLSLRLRRFAAQIESLSLKEVPSRLATHLVYLAEEQGRADQVQLDIPKGQLASLLGTSPETLSRILASMSAEGLIRVDGKRIELLDYQELLERQA
jgi:CRP/FNR family transcriptional regulator